MTTPSDEWENLLLAAGGEGTLLVGFKNEALRIVRGQDAAEVATLRGKSPEETAMDLVVEDGSRVQVVYFLMSEDNVKRQIALPWVSFGSDAASMAPEGVFLKTSTHPRAYGNFARLLGKYVRDEQVIPLEEAIRKLTSLPADDLRIKERGRLAAGLLRRRRGVRSEDDRRSRDLREAAPVRDRREARVRQRRAGAEGRRAHRREARPGRARAGLEVEQVRIEVRSWN